MDSDNPYIYGHGDEFSLKISKYWPLKYLSLVNCVQGLGYFVQYTCSRKISLEVTLAKFLGKSCGLWHCCVAQVTYYQLCGTSDPPNPPIIAVTYICQSVRRLAAICDQETSQLFLYHGQIIPKFVFRGPVFHIPKSYLSFLG